MSKKFKVKTKAVFNGQPVGSTIELNEDTARKYEAMKYLDIISEVKATPAKKSTSATKKPATRRTSTAKKTAPKTATKKATATTAKK